MCGGRVGEVGGGVADVATQHHEARVVLVLHAAPHARLQGVEVVGHLADLHDVPAVGAEAFGDVVGVGELGGAVDGDVVVVVDDYELAEVEVACEGAGLVAHTFHEVAVGGHHEDVVVAHRRAELGAQSSLGHRHADRHGETLAEGTGRDLDAGRVLHLGVARGDGSPLTELFEILEAHVVAGEVQHRIEEHRRVPAREHEAVAVGPVGFRRVVVHDACPEHVCEGSECHGRSRVARVGLLDGVHRQPADDVDAPLLEILSAHPSALPVGPGLRVLVALRLGALSL